MNQTELKEKRKRIEELVLGVLKRIDNKKMLNYSRYESMFRVMSDEDFAKWAASMGHELDDTIQVWQLPFEELNMDNIRAAADFLNIPLEEYIWFRHTGDKEIRSRVKVPVGFVPIKRVQQLLAKKNAYAYDNEETELKSGQVKGDSRVGSITDYDTSAMLAIGATDTLKEFLGPRADHLSQKQEMYSQIAKNGYFTFSELTDDSNKSSVTLNTINTYMLASGIRSDLLTTGLKTVFTIENAKRR